MVGKLSTSPAVILRSESQYYNTYAAFDYRNVKTEFLTKEEHATLEYISDKCADIGEISSHSGMKPSRCEKFLKRMLKSGIVQERAEPTRDSPLKRAKGDPSLYKRFPLPLLSAPTSIDIFITSRCNLRCAHCFSNSDHVPKGELSVEELQSVFSQLESLGVFEVRINGGEPLLHPKIAEILMNLKERRFRKVILTNGTVLDEKTISLLEEMEVIPTVSLDGSDSDEHDSFRGVKGSFAKAIEALKLLQKNGMQYGINCCLHKKNLSKYKKIIDLAVQHGASRIAFLDLKPSGRMKMNPEWIPTYDEYEEVMLRLMVARMRYRNKIDVPLDTFLHCQPLKEVVEEAKRGYISCQAGRTGLSIDSMGGVFPCNLVISDPEWNMGNIRDNSIQDIWLSDRWSFFRGEVTIETLTRCRVCKSRARCRDLYCRLLPYVAHGNPLGPHPKCAQISIR